MEALVCVEPRKFEYKQVERPKASENTAIIRIKRIGICGTDLHAYEGTQPFLTYPRTLGHELAGELVDFDNAPGFKKGEPVSFIPYVHCGTCIACRLGKTNCCASLKVFGVHIDGGMTEYLSVPSSSLLHGTNLNWEELALVEPLAIGAHGIGRAGVQSGEFVLVIGAGPIGMGAIKFAMIAGAEVIAMDINDSRLLFCKEELGVLHTINALDSDAHEQIRRITKADMPTMILDATGNQKAINHAFRYMAHGGRYVLVGLQGGEITFSHPEFHKREGTLMSSRNANRADFEYVLACLGKGLINSRAYVTHRVRFSEVKSNFDQWLNPNTGVIKVIVEL